jgi:hypothetical protein
VRFVNGFVPALGSRFALVTCGGVCSGSFATLDLPAGLEAYVEVRPEAATLVVGPPVSADAPALPTTLALHAPTPNPSSRAATVRVDLPEPGRIRLAVLDALGREVAVLLDAERPAGAHAAPLDASRLAPGVYVVRLDSPGGVLTRRLTVAR